MIGLLGDESDKKGTNWQRPPIFRVLKKVKVTLVQALRLCRGRTARRGSRCIALPFHDHGTRRGWVVRVTSQSLFTPGKDPVPIVQEAGWAPGSSGQVRKISPPTGIRYPDCPARSQSLYRLSYPAIFRVLTKYFAYRIIKYTQTSVQIEIPKNWHFSCPLSISVQYKFSSLFII